MTKQDSRLKAKRAGATVAAVAFLAIMLMGGLPVGLAHANVQTVTVTVDSSIGNSALPGAQVVVNGTGPYVTGSNGQTTFPFFGNGSYLISASKEGYTNASQTYPLNTANLANTTISFTLTADLQAIAISATGPNSVTATINGNSATLPVTEHWLPFSSQSVSVPATVTISGTTWKFSSWSNGEVENAFTFTTPDSALSLTAAYTKEQSAPNPTVTVTVDSSVGGALPGALVMVNGTGPFTTGSNGETTFAFFGNGTYQITASKEGYNNASNNYDLTTANIASQPITFTLAPDLQQISIATAGVTSGVTGMIDGASVNLPITENWIPFNIHTISVPAILNESGGVEWKFTGWSNGLTTTSISYTVPTSSATLTATYVLNSVTVKLAVTGLSTVSGTVDGSSATIPISETWLIGSTHSIVVPQNVTVSGTLYKFDGWTGGSSSSLTSLSFVVPSSGTTLTAGYVVDSVTVTIKLTGPGSASAVIDGKTVTLPTTENWVIGSVNTLVAPKNVTGPSGTGSLYVFTGWSGAAVSSSESLSFTVPSAAATLTVGYQVEYELTTTWTSNFGSVNVQPTGWYPAGQVVSVTATPVTNYRFVTWTLNGQFNSTTNPISITMNQAQALKAIFVLNTVSVTIQVVGPTSITATLSGKATSFPQTVTATVGTSYPVVFSSVIADGTGARWMLSSISLNGTAESDSNFTISTSVSETYTITFQQQYYLAVSSSTPLTTVNGSGWFAVGTSVTSSPSPKVSLPDGSVLVLQGYILDGTQATQLSVKVDMSATQSLEWVYTHEYKVIFNAVGDNEAPLGKEANFTVSGEQITNLPVQNGNFTYLVAGNYVIRVYYAGLSAGNANYVVNASGTYTATVQDYLTASGFQATVTDGFLQSMSYVNGTLNVSADSLNGTLSIVIPTDAYPDDFFVVNGVSSNAEVFDATTQTLTIPFTGTLVMSITAPAGLPNSISQSDIAQIMVGSKILNEFRIVEIPGNTTEYGVYFQTPSANIGTSVAVPFKPVVDPSGTYTIMFGLPVNGQILFTISSVDSVSAVVVPYQLQSGQVTQLDLSQTPQTPYYDDIPMVVGQAYNIEVGGVPLGALEWTVGNTGLISVSFLSLSNQVVATAAATVTDKALMSIQGTSGTISVEFETLNSENNVVRVYGTSQVTGSELSGNSYGPQPLTLGVGSGADCNIPGQDCTVTSDITGSFTWVILQFTPPSGVTDFNFNVTINGVIQSQLANQSALSGINPAYQVQTTCSATLCQIWFVPGRAGTFDVTATSSSFAGTYVGSFTVLATMNGYRTGIPAAIGVVGVFSGFIVLIRRRTGKVIQPKGFDGESKY